MHVSYWTFPFLHIVYVLHIGEEGIFYKEYYNFLSKAQIIKNMERISATYCTDIHRHEYFQIYVRGSPRSGTIFAGPDQIEAKTWNHMRFWNELVWILKWLGISGGGTSQRYSVPKQDQMSNTSCVQVRWPIVSRISSTSPIKKSRIFLSPPWRVTEARWFSVIWIPYQLCACKADFTITRVIHFGR